LEPFTFPERAGSLNFSASRGSRSPLSTEDQALPLPAQVTSDADLPAKSDVVIVGGGIIGAATALELAERGIEVTLCEKGIIAGEQSSRNWGWCRQMGRDPREIPLILKSLQLWRELNQRTRRETGFNQCGILYLCETDAELASKAEWFEAYAKPYELETKLVSSEEASRLQPGSSRRWAGALYTPSDGRAEPQAATSAIIHAARDRGAKVFANCAVRGIETAAGKVCGVVTEKGPVACSAVVLAGGAWSRLFLGNIGIDFPQLTVVNSVMRTAPLDIGLTCSCSGGRFAFRLRQDGGYTIAHRHLSVADITPDSFRLFFKFLPALLHDWKGLRLRLGKRFIEAARLPRSWRLDRDSPFEKVRILDPEPVSSVLDEASASLLDWFPSFKSMQIAERWAGAIDVTPDAVPVISPVDQQSGLYLASGFSGHGFGLGPGAGKLMADIVCGTPPCVDPAPFRFSRFFDGSRPKLVAGL
jgi:glycine/D-amino acid oxidase-like deaminating enzyme